MKSTYRILLIDDEPLTRDELGELLSEEGYDVVTASDGEEGLSLFRTQAPDMVFTDVRMPRRDGLSVVLAIREEAPMTPVTIITGHGSETMAIEALRAGVTDFIKKPVRLDDLTAALDRMETALRQARHARPSELASQVLVPVEQSWTYHFGNELPTVTAFVDVLLQPCAQYGASARELAELSLALRELLINAIEHGNLGITSKEKAEALEKGTLRRLLADRLALDAFRSRCVRVVAQLKHDKMVVEVRDEGTGFDWRCLPDPTDLTNLLHDHGRGVLLARLSVDELCFNDPGNAVTVVKSFRKRSGTSRS